MLHHNSIEISFNEVASFGITVQGAEVVFAAHLLHRYEVQEAPILFPRPVLDSITLTLIGLGHRY